MVVTTREENSVKERAAQQATVANTIAAHARRMHARSQKSVAAGTEVGRSMNEAPEAAAAAAAAQTCKHQREQPQLRPLKEGSSRSTQLAPKAAAAAAAAQIKVARWST